MTGGERNNPVYFNVQFRAIQIDLYLSYSFHRCIMKSYPQPRFYHRSDWSVAFGKAELTMSSTRYEICVQKLTLRTQRYYAPFVFSLSLQLTRTKQRNRNNSPLRDNLSGPITLRWLVLSIQPFFFSKTSFFLQFSYRSVATGYAIVSI